MKARITVVMLVYMLLVATANASPVTLSPAVDGYADNTVPGWANIFEFDDFLGAELQSSGLEQRSALEFDISGIAAGMEITSATLNLFAAASTPTISVQGYTGNGTLEAGDFAVDNEITQFNPQPINTIDVTSFVQGEYAAGSQFAGFQLRELVLDVPNRFSSSENIIAGLRPSLSITYRVPALPEPASLALVMLGVGGLGLARKVCA